MFFENTPKKVEKGGPFLASLLKPAKKKGGGTPKGSRPSDSDATHPAGRFRGRGARLVGLHPGPLQPQGVLRKWPIHGSRYRVYQNGMGLRRGVESKPRTILESRLGPLPLATLPLLSSKYSLLFCVTRLSETSVSVSRFQDQMGRPEPGDVPSDCYSLFSKNKT